SSGPPGAGTAGVAVFNAVPAGSYCATAALASPSGKGATALPFAVTAGGTANTTETILPVPPFSPDISGLYVANSSSITVYAPGAALDSAGNLYVTNRSGASITVYPPAATGNMPPARTISGTNTELTFPLGVALDGTGNLYVTNLVVNSILVFPAGATDNVPPLRTISGTNTGLSSPTGVVLDNAGNLYVTNNNVNSITVYPPGASGNVPPSRTISGG